MPALTVSSLHIYPVKGCRGVDIRSTRAEERGLVGDRRWVIVDDANRALTQRDIGALATIVPALEPDGLVLSCGGTRLTAALDVTARTTITIWNDTIDAAAADDATNADLSDYLGQRVRLVAMDHASRRVTAEKWGAARAVSFADAFPYLITTTGSLDRLNAEIRMAGGASAPMERFRPNIVIDCDEPWAEDWWKIVRIGTATFDLLKPCDRCIVTTMDQKTGAPDGPEPIRSLIRLRKSADTRISGVLFGWNAAASAEGQIAVGDALTVIERRAETWPIATA